MHSTVRNSLLLALISLASVTAFARHHGNYNPQAYQSQQTNSGVGQNGSHHTTGQFDYYLLTLSWSPSYCVTHAYDTAQCGSKGYGFVLHGLWPQYATGGYPQSCDTPNTLTREAVSFGNTLFPSPKLVSHEWDKHGTCSGFDAMGYFRAADKALTSVRVPASLQAPVKTLFMSPADIAAAFVQTNPGMPSNAVTVACSGPDLSEVRVCMSRDLHPMACGKGVRNSCRSGSDVRIQAVR